MLSSLTYAIYFAMLTSLACNPIRSGILPRYFLINIIMLLSIDYYIGGVNLVAGRRNGLELPESNGRMRHRQGARATSFNQVFVLVEIDVEVIEHGNIATLIGAERIVVHVNRDTDQTLLKTSRRRACRSDHDNLVLHNRNFDDLAGTDAGSQIGFGIVQSAAGTVLQEQHVAVDVGSREERRSAGTLILLAAENDLVDHLRS